jgi:hypothetical protein
LASLQRQDFGGKNRTEGKLEAVDVRFGSLADMAALNIDVRFTPASGHFAQRAACPLSANSGHSYKKGRGALDQPKGCHSADHVGRHDIEPINCSLGQGGPEPKCY